MSKISADHISMVIDFLNEHACYAVLRNYEGLPDNNQSRDIDIIIPRSDYNRIKRQLVQLIARTGWKVLTYLNSLNMFQDNNVAVTVGTVGYMQMLFTGALLWGAYGIIIGTPSQILNVGQTFSKNDTFSVIELSVQSIGRKVTNVRK